MLKYFALALVAVTLLITGCDNKKLNTIKFATSADYPPFEYYEEGKITGFDIELAKLIAQELKKEAIFEDMQFNAILASLQNGSVDAAISTITATEERQKGADFSQPYYSENLAVVFHKDTPIMDKTQLAGKKIICQLGSTMEIWLKKQDFPGTEIIIMDNNNQAIEALKARHADGVLINDIQGKAFSEKNEDLGQAFIAQTNNSYAIAFKKGSPLKDEIDKALSSLSAKGELTKLEEKWLGKKND